jgi:hypothetical protein
VVVLPLDRLPPGELPPVGACRCRLVGSIQAGAVVVPLPLDRLPPGELPPVGPAAAA